MKENDQKSRGVRLEGSSTHVYYLRHKKRGSVFLAYLRFLSLKFKKLYEFRGKNQII